MHHVHHGVGPYDHLGAAVQHGTQPAKLALLSPVHVAHMMAETPHFEGDEVLEILPGVD